VAVAAEDVARSAGLRYVYDSMPGYRRIRAGRGFRIVDAEGRPVRDKDELDRIRALAIPPAWTDVWVCPHTDGHIQATGRDARGRKQYRYHHRWRAVRDETKFDRLTSFGRALPKIRRRVRRDLARNGIGRERVLATVVELLDRTFLRVGNDEYARDNGSYGLTTLRGSHVVVSGPQITFSFRGKGGKLVSLDIEHPRCARVIRRCRDLPGYRLFRYVDDDGELGSVDSDHVNAYLREITGEDLSAKDFRTWAGTVLFARAAHEAGPGRSARDTTKRLNDAIGVVAEMLGNTPAVCRACYVHPAVVDSYVDGSFESLWDQHAGARIAGLRGDEATLLGMLRTLSRRKKPQRRAA
jgi:DNA topoisomerase-1